MLRHRSVGCTTFWSASFLDPTLHKENLFPGVYNRATACLVSS